MALKPFLKFQDMDTSKFSANVVASRGYLMVATGTAPSGEAWDQTGNKCALPINPSGKEPVGVLMHNIVNIDLNRQILNPYDFEVQLGDKVTLLTKGEILTDAVYTWIGAPTVGVGTKAYLGPSGKFSNHARGTNGASSRQVGTFQGTADEDGYYKIRVNL